MMGVKSGGLADQVANWTVERVPFLKLLLFDVIAAETATAVGGHAIAPEAAAWHRRGLG